MKVSEILNALKNCDASMEVFCGAEGEQLIDADAILTIIEAKTLTKEKDKESIDGVYFIVRG